METTNDNTKFIYVITCGEYSDYTIRGVTTNKEYAKKMRERIEDYYGDAEIETYIDGEQITDLMKRGYLFYRAVFDVKYKLTLIHPMNVTNTTAISDNKELENDCLICDCIDFCDEIKETNFGFMADIFAKDEDHAKKIAYDKMAQYRAEKMENELLLEES